MKEIVLMEVIQYRSYQTELLNCERLQWKQSDDELDKRIRGLRARLVMIESWLDLLTLDERQILQMHLIDGVDWGRIALKYQTRWGDNNGRSERSLKRYQENALNRIAEFVSDHRELFPELQTQ